MKNFGNTALRPAKLAKTTTKHLDNGRGMGNAAGLAVADKYVDVKELKVGVRRKRDQGTSLQQNPSVGGVE
ncbi:unnamed protein product [Clavelina lepadiformis]|uniref:Uncharacterized protein n=1 Tax=Clavelina lepadiformis TaxID=159417 RepID=A0ABP0FQ83_CLALP